MEKVRNTLIVAIILCIVAVITFLGLPGIIFFWCMLTDDGGKLDSVEKISAVVTEKFPSVSQP